LKELSSAGVKELKFIGENLAVDQYGRKIKFQRTVESGMIRLTFRFV